MFLIVHAVVFFIFLMYCISELSPESMYMLVTDLLVIREGVERKGLNYSTGAVLNATMEQVLPPKCQEKKIKTILINFNTEYSMATNCATGPDKPVFFVSFKT